MKKIDIKTIMLLLTMTLLTASCSTINTHSDYAPGIDFKSYKTFSWISEDPLIKGTGNVDVSPLNVQRMKDAIQSDLISKGYQFVPLDATPDFTVSFTVGTRDKITVDSYPPYYRRSRWDWPFYHDDVIVHSYTEGTLAVDIFDQSSGKPAWHGVAKKQVLESDAANAQALINTAVTAILAKFPSR